jgi:hypothetical protein
MLYEVHGVWMSPCLVCDGHAHVEVDLFLFDRP